MIVVNPYKKKRKKRKPRVHTGAIVNPDFPEPRSPGPWVTDRVCICGDTYKAFRGGVSFAEASNMIRVKAKSEGDQGGGFRSRGPVLWVMRVMKLESWYQEHLYCGEQLRDLICDGCYAKIPCRECMTKPVIDFFDSLDS